MVCNRSKGLSCLNSSHSQHHSRIEHFYPRCMTNMPLHLGVVCERCISGTNVVFWGDVGIATFRWLLFLLLTSPTMCPYLVISRSAYHSICTVHAISAFWTLNQRQQGWNPRFSMQPTIFPVFDDLPFLKNVSRSLALLSEQIHPLGSNDLLILLLVWAQREVISKGSLRPMCDQFDMNRRKCGELKSHWQFFLVWGAVMYLLRWRGRGALAFGYGSLGNVGILD